MRRFAALVVLFLACCPGYVRAQSSSASLTGYITDPSKAFIADAKVIAINIATNVRYEVATDKSGSYYITNLSPGTYRVEVERAGFKTVVKSGVILHVQDTIAINFEMVLGSVSEIVTVKAGTVQVNTRDSSVSTVVDRQFVGNIPLNGRSFQSLILLSPGVVGTPSNEFTPGEFSVNGQRATANYFTIDGASANTGVSSVGVGGGGVAAGGAFSEQAGGALPGTTALGTTASLVSIDALEEFKNQTSTYSAEFGRQPGGQIQLVTRSGTNQFHGTVFEYFRNDALDATDWFYGPTKALYASFGQSLPKPELRQNQFGGVLGGPITKDKTFFLFSYEGQRLRIPVVGGLPHVPSLRLRQAAAPALQPILNAYPLPTGPESAELQDPNLPYDSVTNPYVPDGSAPFVTSYSNPSTVDAYSVRLDHRLGNKLSLFGRYASTPSHNLTRTLNQLAGSVLSSHTLTVGANLSVTSRLNDEFRFNYTSNRGRSTFTLDNLYGALPPDQSTLLSGYSGPEYPKQAYLYFGLQGYGFPALYSGADVDNYSRQANLVDNTSLVKGAHQLKFGIDWRRLNPTYAPAGYLQQPLFLSQQSIISGTVDELDILVFKGASPIYENFSSYAQDDWKLSPRLTVNLGVRWEVNPAPHDSNGLRPVLLTGINGFDVSKATLAPPNAPYYKTFYTAFGPRVGMAYQLDQRSGRETVLRGGFGVYYDLGSGLSAGLFSRFPFNSYSIVPGASEGGNTIPFPIPPALAQPPAYPAVQLPLPESLSALNPYLKLPYTLQWNVALEQVLGQQTITVSYVASAARRLLTQQRLNQGRPDPVTGVVTRPNPNFKSVLYTDNGPTADYESLQAQYQRSLSRGLQALVNYTWSHAIDVVSNDYNEGALARGNADFDVRHNFSGAVTYELPRLSSTGPLAEPIARFVKAIANDWSVDSTFYARTGTPLNLSTCCADYIPPDGYQVNVRPDVVPGQPFWIKDPTVPGGQRLNPAAFTTAPADSNGRPIRQGTLGRNAVRVPGYYQVNMGVRRQIHLGERLKMEAKAEAFNVLNHPNFGNYNIFFYSGNPTFGVPQTMLAASLTSNGVGLNSLYQIGGPRSIQLSLKLAF